MIAVTGGLGTGKSTVSRVLALALEARLIDTDQICREQLEVGAEGYREVLEQFGSEFLHSNGLLNRDLLRQEVFNNKLSRDKLEAILHPLIFKELECINKSVVGQKQAILVEVPLLFEVGWKPFFDCTIVVYVPEELCKKRVEIRDNLPIELINNIISAQLDIDQKRGLADYCVDNSGTFASTQQQVYWLARLLKARKNSGHSN